jgi:hypothetical protein
MLTELGRALTAASLASLAAGAPSALAQQAERPWVDPPAKIEPAKPRAPAVAPAEAPRPSAPEREKPAAENRAASRPASRATAQREETAARSRPARAKAHASRSRAVVAQREVHVAPRHARPAPRRIAERHVAPRVRISRAARPLRTTGFNTVQDAVDSGLQLMRLQTLEYPDGRRVDVLTRLPPEEMERVLSRPYPR